MKKIPMLLCALVAFAALSSCDDTATYAEQKKTERNAISAYVRSNGINTITVAEFLANDTTTDVSKNEYVLFPNSGVYMQIVRKGCGQKIQDGETVDVLCRFTERNILTDSITLTNNILYYSSIVDKMQVANTSGTFTGSFVSGQSVMYSVYGSLSVPEGWLVPFSYINVGRLVNDGDETAKVKLIVPSDYGTTTAAASVIPYMYEITFERGR